MEGTALKHYSYSYYYHNFLPREVKRIPLELHYLKRSYYFINIIIITIIYTTTVIILVVLVQMFIFSNSLLFSCDSPTSVCQLPRAYCRSNGGSSAVPPYKRGTQ